jgi:hypothetical protein
VVTGGAQWLHHEPIWARLDTIKARVPSMVLVTTGQHRGADKIAAAWAAHNGVHTILFRLNHRSGGKAGFDRNKGLINLQPVEAIICEGSFCRWILPSSAGAMACPSPSCATPTFRRGPAMTG